MRDVHVVFTDYKEDGWGIASPQVPGLVGGRATASEAAADLEGILEWCGFEPGTYNLHRHEEKYAISPRGDEFMLRFAVDGPEGRDQAIGRMLHAIEHDEYLDDLPRMPSFVTGEHLIISVLADDTIGWILDQLGDREGAYLQFYAGDDALYGIPIYDTDQEMGRGTTTLEKLGLTRDSVVRDLIDAVAAEEVDSLRLSIQHLPSLHA